MPTGDLDTGVQSVRITGRGMGVTSIDNGLDRALDLVEGASLTLEDLTVRNGRGPAGIRARRVGRSAARAP